MKAREQRLYGAISLRGDGEYHVAYKLGRYGLSWRLVGDIRSFQTFEDADECAKRVASGEFEQWEAGEYVSMR